MPIFLFPTLESLRFRGNHVHHWMDMAKGLQMTNVEQLHNQQNVFYKKEHQGLLVDEESTLMCEKWDEQNEYPTPYIIDQKEENIFLRASQSNIP